MAFHIHNWIEANREVTGAMDAAEAVGFDPDCFTMALGGEDAAMVLSGIVMAQYVNPLTCITSGEAEIIAKALEIGYKMIKDDGLSQEDAILVQGLQARALIAKERLK